jgi:hypothetical protein
VFNREFTELHHRTAHKASLLRRIFSRCSCFRDALAFADRRGGEKTDDYCCAIERTILQTAGRSPRPGLALHNQAQKTSKKKIGPYEGRTRDLGVCKA